MKFEEALIQSVEQFGNTIVTEARIVNILSDWNAYCDQPACKLILREVVANGIPVKILSHSTIDLAKIYIRQVVHEMSKSHGFQEDLIEHVLYSILNATKPKEERIKQSDSLQYDYIGSKDEHGFQEVQKNGKWGFISADGNVIVPILYDNVRSFHEGLAAVSKEGKEGFVNTTGEVVIDLKFDSVYNFRSDVAKVQLNGLYGLINKSGKMLLSIEYDFIDSIISDNMIGICKDGLWGFADLSGNVVIRPQYEKIIKHFSKGYAAVLYGYDKIVINNKGKIIQYL